VKHFLLVVTLVLSLFIPTTSYATGGSNAISPAFYCIGSNQQPPCVTRSPSPSNSVSQVIPNGNTSSGDQMPIDKKPGIASVTPLSQSNQSATPCTSTVAIASVNKTRAPEPEGLLQQVTGYVVNSVASLFTTGGTPTADSTPSNPCQQYAAPTGLQVQPGTNTVAAGKWSLTVEWNKITQTTTGVTVESPNSYTSSLIETLNGKQTTLSTNANVACTANICTYSFKNVSVAARSGQQPNIVTTQPIYTVQVKANTSDQIGGSAYTIIPVLLGGDGPAGTYAAPTGLQVQPGSNTVAAGKWSLTVEWNRVTQTTTGIAVEPPVTYTLLLIKTENGTKTTLSGYQGALCTTSLCSYSFKNIPVAATSPAAQLAVVNPSTPTTYTVEIKANGNAQINSSAYATLQVPLGETTSTPKSTPVPTVMPTINSPCRIHPSCNPGFECPDIIGECTPTVAPTQPISKCSINPSCKAGQECPDFIGGCAPTQGPTAAPTQPVSGCLIHPNCKVGQECPDIIGVCPPKAAMTGLLVSNVTNGTASKSKYCLDNYQNNPVILLACNSADTTQKWTSYNDNTIKINGKCLTEQGTTLGALVTTAACNGSASQVWNNATDQGPTKLINKQSNMCLDIRAFSLSNTQLEIYTCNGGGNQMWSWTTSTLTPPTGDIYTGQVEANSISGGEKLCLENKNNSLSSGNPILASACNSSSESLQWVENTSGTIKSSTNEGYCLDVHQQGTVDHTLVDLNKCTGAANQLWQSKLITTGQAKGLTEFVSKQSGKCLTIPSSGTTAQMEIDTCNNSNNQVWNWRG